MSDFVIVNGDKLSVNFGPTVIPPAQGPQPLIGSSRDFFVKDSPVCLQGDEIPPSLKGPLPYTEGPFLTPGQGTLAVYPQTTQVLKNRDVALLLKGTQFRATFTVTQPAIDPTTGATDPPNPKEGTASFTTSNNILTAN